MKTQREKHKNSRTEDRERERERDKSTFIPSVSLYFKSLILWLSSLMEVDSREEYQTVFFFFETVFFLSLRPKLLGITDHQAVTISFLERRSGKRMTEIDAQAYHLSIVSFLCCHLKLLAEQLVTR